MKRRHLSKDVAFITYWNYIFDTNDNNTDDLRSAGWRTLHRSVLYSAIIEWRLLFRRNMLRVEK
jgi:hypothetical protein